MKNRLIKEILLWGGIFCSHMLLQAQVAGDVANVKFEEVENPVPKQAAVGGNKGTNPAGCFYHATYTGSAWGDYNNDGYLDLFYSDKNEHIHASKIQSNFYKNNGDGTFTRLDSPFEGTAFSCPVWFDMNNDGLLDLLLPGLNDWNYAWLDGDTQFDQIKTHLYINRGIASDGTVTFEEIPESETGILPIYNGKTGGKGHNWVSVGDYNNDGYVDIIMTGFDDCARPDSEHPEDAVRVVYLYKNINGERFELQSSPLKGGGAFHGETDGSVCFSDLDGDGWLDIMSSGYGLSRNSELHIYWNNGNGTFTESDQTFLGVNDSSCGICDLNNDGLPDLVVPGYYFNTKTKQFYFYKNLGDRKFEKVDVAILEGIDGGQLSFGDVNQDGLTDILVGGHGAEHEHTTWLYINQGDFDFAVYGAHYDDPFGKKGHFSRITHGSHHLIDYDNDGFLDAWLMGWSNGECSNGCEAKLWKNIASTKGVKSNEAPAVPANLVASFDKSTDVATFTWSAPTDDVTPSAALRYNFYLREKGSDKIFMTVPADLQTGFVRVGKISGELIRCSYQMNVKAAGEYEWGVQAIDNGNKGGMFASSTLKVEEVSGIDAISENDDIRIWNSGSSLYYAIKDAGELTLFNANGGIVSQKRVFQSGNFELPGKGIYIVMIRTASSVKRQKISFT